MYIYTHELVFIIYMYTHWDEGLFMESMVQSQNFHLPAEDCWPFAWSLTVRLQAELRGAYFTKIFIWACVQSFCDDFIGVHAGWIKCLAGLVAVSSPSVFSDDTKEAL